MLDNTDSETVKFQDLVAKLRTDFLKAVNELNGDSCRILTYEKSSLQGNFSGWKPDGSEILVNNLKTPLNMHMDYALMRVPDILSIRFDKKTKLLTDD